MTHIRKKIFSFIFIIFLTLLVSLTAFAGTTIVYNGDSSGGWYSSGSFNLASYGYDGSMYWQNADEPFAFGGWKVDTSTTSYYNYYIYIPNAYSSATVTYYCFYDWGDRVDINVNQSSYSNEWVYLGNYRVTSSADDVNAIALGNSNVSSGIVGWDEAKFSN